MNELKKITRDCRKATYLIDKKLTGNITFRETIALRIHLLGCDVCGIYKKQTAVIEKMITGLLTNKAAKSTVLDDEYKHKLQLKLNHLNKN